MSKNINLGKVKNLINNMSDVEMLEVAYELLNEMADINNLEQQIEQRKAKLSDGKRAAFYFFADGLDNEELSYAANTARGRINHINMMKGQTAAVAPEEKVEVRQPTNTFGGLGGMGGFTPQK